MSSSISIRKAILHTLADYRGTPLEMSQRDLSAQSGISEGNLSKFLSGKKDINVETLQDILAAMPDEMRKHCLALIS